jgi:hypothetical protein
MCGGAITQTYAAEIVLMAHSPRYDAKVNHCYGEFIDNVKLKPSGQTREMRSLYDMQIEDLLAFTKVENGKKVGMVFDHSHQATSMTNLGWDDAGAYIDQMMEDKR